MFLIVLAVIIVLLWIYILFVREFLDAHLQGTSYAWWHESIEDKLWAKSRTILIARGYLIGGVVIFVHDQLASLGFDVTPILNEVGKFVPETYRPLALAVFLGVTGLAFEYLRRITTTAVGETK